FWHRQLAPVISRIAGASFAPTYAYFASYVAGAKLARHTDRADCEISVSYLLDYSPWPNGRPSPWPIRLERAEGTVRIRQRIGDALVFRGRQLPHSRGALPSGHASTHLFFHYVPADSDEARAASHAARR